MTESEFDVRVEEYINWQDSPYSHSISPANPERINGVGDELRSLGVEPTKELSLENVAVIRNPLQKYAMTDNQRIAIRLGANFMRTQVTFECVADESLTTILDALGVEKAKQGANNDLAAIDLCRKIYFGDY